MIIPEHLKTPRGATNLGFLDILVALILLGVLLFASYLQFPNYQRLASPPPPPATGAPSTPK